MLPATPFFATLVALSTAVSASPIPSAPAITDNPTDVVLRADFPEGNSQTIVGVMQFYSLNGTAKVHVDVTGLPKNSGVFSYHIHDKPVGADKSCSGTGDHFNPFGASADCEAMGDDALCEIGDLSGKHGLINTTCFELFYYDPYLSLDPSSPQYIGGKAINIHLENGDRLACATIKPSREPEDLLLLNVETEADEVKKFEDLAGITQSSAQYIHATAIPMKEVSTTGPASAELPVASEQPVEEEDLDLDINEGSFADDWIPETEEDDSVELDTEPDESILDEVDNTTNSTKSANSTVIYDFTNVTNGSDASDEYNEEENNAMSLSSCAAFIVAAALAFLI